MSATALDRRHARSVELALEVRVLAEELVAIDARDDAVRRRERVFAGALRDWIRSIVASVPGGRRGWAFLAGLFDAMRTRDALERLDDTRRAQLVAAAIELPALLEERPA